MRALESALPEGERLFFDPWARVFLSGGARRIVDLCGSGAGRAILAQIMKVAIYGQHAFLVARTSFIDEALAAALARGARQVLILGAGYDSRAHRIPGIEHALVFEVDHPDTQACKREILAHRAEAGPAHLRYVGVDFNRQRLDDELGAAGFRAGELTFVVWEGVPEYLEPAAVDATLRLLARSVAETSELVFTYLDRAMVDGTVPFRGAQRHLAMQRRIGEPFTFGLHPAEVGSYLRERGFGLLDDLAGEQLVRRYFAPRGRRDRPNAYQHIARACVESR